MSSHNITWFRKSRLQQHPIISPRVLSESEHCRKMNSLLHRENSSPPSVQEDCSRLKVGMIIKGSIYTSTGEFFHAALKLTYKWHHVTWLWWVGWTKGLINCVSPSSLTLTKGRLKMSKILFQVGELQRQPQCSKREQLHLLVAPSWCLCWLSLPFPSAVFVSSAVPFILSTRQCWIGIKTLCVGVRF